MNICVFWFRKLRSSIAIVYNLNDNLLEESSSIFSIYWPSQTKFHEDVYENIHICKFKNIYTTRWSTIDPKFEDVMPAFHGRFFLTFYPFSVQEHNKWVGTKNFIQTVQIRTALMFRVLGVAWNNQFRSSWSCHPTARSGGRQDNTMIMAYADSLYKYKYI